MKGFGNLLLALGIVALAAVILEEALGWKMLPSMEIELFIGLGSLVLILIGVIIRSIGKSKEAKKNNQ